MMRNVNLAQSNIIREQVPTRYIVSTLSDTRKECVNIKNNRGTDNVEYTQAIDGHESVKESFYQVTQYVMLTCKDDFHNEDYESFLVKLIERMNRHSWFYI